MMRAEELRPVPVVPRAKGQLREGFRYVWSDRLVRTPLLMMAVIGTLAFNFQVVISLISTETFELGAGGLGALLAVMGAGAVFGALAAASRRGVSYRRLLSLTYGMGVAIMFAALAPTLAAEVVALFVMGAFSFAFIAVANTTLQLTSRADMRGRVMALYSIAFLGTTPIGSPIIGWISSVWGPRAGFAVGGIAALLAGAAASYSLSRARDVRDRAHASVALPAT
jgi:predicted MFS family arabinose efflux permease